MVNLLSYWQAFPFHCRSRFFQTLLDVFSVVCSFFSSQFAVRICFQKDARQSALRLETACDQYVHLNTVKHYRGVYSLAILSPCPLMEIDHHNTTSAYRCCPKKTMHLHLSNFVLYIVWKIYDVWTNRNYFAPKLLEIKSIYINLH